MSANEKIEQYARQEKRKYFLIFGGTLVIAGSALFMVIYFFQGGDWKRSEVKGIVKAVNALENYGAQDFSLEISLENGDTILLTEQRYPDVVQGDDVVIRKSTRTKLGGTKYVRVRRPES